MPALRGRHIANRIGNQKVLLSVNLITADYMSDLFRLNNLSEYISIGYHKELLPIILKLAT